MPKRTLIVALSLSLAGCGAQVVFDPADGGAGQGGSGNGGSSDGGAPSPQTNTGTTASTMPETPTEICTALVDRICGCCAEISLGYSCDPTTDAHQKWIETCAADMPDNAPGLATDCSSLPTDCSSASDVSPCFTAPCEFAGDGSCFCV